MAPLLRVLDEDAHMQKYIEDQLKLRLGKTVDQAAEDEADPEAKRRKLDAELYAVPSDFKNDLEQELILPGMVSTLSEVALTARDKLASIEATEALKRRLLAKVGQGYLDSLYACDWPVSDACVAQKGSDPCQAEMAAAHEHEYDAGETIGTAPVSAAQPLLPTRASAADLFLAESGQVEAVRRQLAAGGQVAAVQVLELIGQGSYARVYRGLWQGRVVALKVMMLPSGLRQQQAQMEAAVSASMNHPSIVQTYSYSFRMVLDSAFSW
ncbi:hypothetical protein TSOC_013841 [Tetrabaena socialis]|uniref:Protein kinase domain-containing protein n=1 Tax=Tetrabaena socialis TaxID=47790 RepID=A0A2J7ZJB0_9CHLO|nr:hypothetical protein TSOC_013841 [Tetrabaena socialis]|eukprot:PNH00340.1 hypothetical protein TSOC_013841 [Tetrabaena socialis]